TTRAAFAIGSRSTVPPSTVAAGGSTATNVHFFMAPSVSYGHSPIKPGRFISKARVSARDCSAPTQLGPDFSSSDFMDSQVSNCGEVVGRAAAFPGRSVVLLLLARGSDHCGQSPAVHRIVPPSVWWAGLIAGHHRAWIPGEAIPLSRDL